MRTLLFSLALLCITNLASAQAKSGDAALDNRLQRYLDLTYQKDFNGLMDLIHPSLFRLAKREELVKAFEEVFSDESLEIGFDTMRVVQIGAPFTNAGIQYRRADYYMVMHLGFRDSSVYAQPGFQEQMVSALQTAFEAGRVTFNPKTRTFILSKNDVLYAIRDTPSTPWTFIGYKRNKAMIEAIFPKEVIAHYKML
ncbi:hypothetical protein [Flaviaesturariibacter aridisoli]|uniref:Uncharacterized protein n=1 Tax=Flaviaesturariibacter aridisoli TaxID=2545761 RepID=A0A4R4E2J6_9BACT|nr:hypothetical protein [Flaviaesturariibacter aridisoli]TCZ73676.1 hypothetical protein E0486_05180 [Flaviaesturariibacter aridisoli]